MDAGWTLGGLWVDSWWTLGGPWVDGTQKKGHGRCTGWSRKVDGLVTACGRDGHGSWTGWSWKVFKIERFTVFFKIVWLKTIIQVRTLILWRPPWTVILVRTLMDGHFIGGAHWPRENVCLNYFFKFPVFLISILNDKKIFDVLENCNQGNLLSFITDAKIKPIPLPGSNLLARLNLYFYFEKKNNEKI